MRYKILSLILITVIVLSALCSCSPSRRHPYITDNSNLSALNGFEMTEENTELDIPHTWDEIIEWCSNYKTGMAIIAEKIYSESYYWENEDGIPSGYTYSVMKFKECLFCKDYPMAFNYLKGSEKKFSIIERYTVSPNDEIVGIAYTIYYVGEPKMNKIVSKHYGKTYNLTSAVMEDGKEYLIYLPASFYPSEHNFIDGYYYNEVGELVQKYVDNSDESMIDEDIGSSIKKYYSFEFSEEAYERSKAIVEAYEAEGKTREDNDYYLYHALVKEGWERFGEVKVKSEE